MFGCHDVSDLSEDRPSHNHGTQESASPVHNAGECGCWFLQECDEGCQVTGFYSAKMFCVDIVNSYLDLYLSFIKTRDKKGDICAESLGDFSFITEDTCKTVNQEMIRKKLSYSHQPKKPLIE